MKVSITSRKSGLFDSCPICDVIIDNARADKILPGKTLSFDLEDNCTHSIYCSYIYGKHNTEKSNVMYLDAANNYNLFLGTVHSKTYIGRFKENINTFFSKGFINVPDIELYEAGKK